MSETKTKREGLFNDRNETPRILVYSDRPSSDSWSRRDFAADITGDEKFRKFDMKEVTNYNLETPSGKMVTIDEEDYEAYSQIEGVSVHSDTRGRKDWDVPSYQVANNLAGYTFDEIGAGEINDVLWITKYKLQYQKHLDWNHPEGGRLANVRTFVKDGKLVKPFNDQEVDDYIDESSDEYPYLKISLRELVCTDKDMRNIRENLIPDLCKAISDIDGVGWVRPVNCFHVTEEKTVCPNV